MSARRQPRRPPATPTRGAAHRRFYRDLALITALGWLLRVLAAWEMAAFNGGLNSVFRPSKLSDLATYLRLSEAIASGQFSEVFYYQPFYYAVFLPLIRLVCGASIPVIPAIVAVQSLCGAAAVWFAGLCGALAWNRRAGLFAAIFAAISVPLLLYTPFAQNETLQSLLLTLTAYLLLKTLRRGRLRDAVAAGAVLGMAVLTRGNAILFLPFVLAILLVRRRRDLRRAALAAGLLTMTVLAVESPFILWNSHKLGRLSGPSTAADAVLALGNTPEAPPGGRDPELPAGPMEYPETYEDFMARSPEESVPRQMLAWFAREPGAFLELQFRKLLLFWNSREIPNNVSLVDQRQASAVLRWDLPGESAVLITLAIAGLLWSLRRMVKGHTALLMLGVLAAVYWGGTALFYNLSRFRAPILPILFVFAGVWCDRAIRVARREGFRAFERRAVPPLLAGVFLCVPAYDLYRNHAEAAIQRLVRPNGVDYEKIDGTRLRFDHGPLTFGGWEPVELRPGLRLEKTFAGPPAAGEWSLTVVSDAPIPVELVGTANNVPFRALCLPGLGTVTQPMAATSHLTIRIDRAAPGLSVLIDRQRRFGRTRIDGATTGELVIRLRSK